MKLKRNLNFIEVFCIAAGTMISSGIFILPGMAFAKTGASVFLSYLFAGMLALTGTFSIVELTSAMPKAGGDYFFITRSLGPVLGTVSGLLSWFALSLKTAFAIIGIAEILYLFFGWNLLLCAIATTVIFLLINIAGVKESGTFEVIIVMLLLGIILFFLLRGFPEIDILKFENFAPNGVSSIFTTAGFVFVAYGGLLKIASISEEVNSPKRNIPLGIFSALFVVTILYTLITMVTVGTAEPDTLRNSITPLADSAAVFLGNPGKILLTIAALLAFISTGNAGIMSASRYPFALSRDQLLPNFISRVNRRFHTPIMAIIVTGVLIALSLLLHLEVLIKTASAVLIMTYILSQLSIIILRGSKIPNYRPSYRAPFFPWIQIISLILFIFLIFDMGLVVIMIAGGLILLGVVIYLIYGRRKFQQQYALLDFISRILNRNFASDNLNSELKQILSERDEIVFDRFDHLVNDAVYKDLDHCLNKDALFEVIAESLAEKTDLPRAEIFKLLQNREAESSTAITDFIAVPHIILEGKNLFEMAIVRCKKGIRFSDEHPAVRAVFVLAGSADERNFHLKALSAVAQISLQADFQKRWLTARDATQLRDLIHLSERHRH
ncbi:MAG: amino acid permease [Candidatus Marinimicrobia bacterium]|nr:amino acid permease [Candidatus Neomarinimicrobiota bacterium]MDD5230175.1 amino acid permease [Candidatus Neomarinimicrobiota bacterium]